MAQVFAYDADGYQLNASEEEDGYHEGRVASYRVAIENGLDNDVCQIAKSKQGYDDAEYGGKAEWGSGERGNACHCQVQQSVIAPFRLSVPSFLLLVIDALFTETYPTEHAFIVAVCLTHLLE